MKNIVLLIYLVILIGCSSTGIVPMDNEMYFVSKKEPQVGFGPSVTLKGDVYREASEFCAKSGKKIETISFESTNAGFAKSPTASLQFKCVAKHGNND